MAGDVIAAEVSAPEVVAVGVIRFSKRFICGAPPTGVMPGLDPGIHQVAQ
jgi:hypothetical protein